MNPERPFFPLTESQRRSKKLQAVAQKLRNNFTGQNLMKHIAFLSLILLATASIAQADWLNFRGPNASGYDPSVKNLPTELSDKTLAWKISLPGRGLGSPVIIGDRIFVTAASELDQKQLHVLCFSSSDGKLICERKFWTTGRTMSHPRPNNSWKPCLMLTAQSSM